MKKKTLFGALALAAAGLFFRAGSLSADEVSPDTALNRNLAIFNVVAQRVAETYVDSMRPQEAIEAAIIGMLYTVDPYTEFYNSEELAAFEQRTTGSWGGIGAYILGSEGDTYIRIPMEGSPAQKAGLRGGDRILQVDSVDVSGKGSDFTTGLLKGAPGTSVHIVVERPYSTDSIISFDVMREKLQEKSVPYYGVVDGVGYLRLNSFMEKSGEEVKDALESIARNPDVDGIVLDLRGNGGGLVSQAVEVLGMFLPKGTKVLDTRGKDGKVDARYVTTRSPVMADMPLVVMIDDNSASASEIVAGAIQDLDRGVLVGRRSFGKGLVQSTFQMPYNTALKVTTSKYHLPSGRLIQALDYSRRKSDGTVAHTPDSLTHEFKTRHGRIVRDGGGLVPDSILKEAPYPAVVYDLVMSNQIFDYATKYAAGHADLPSPSEFVISEELFEDFVASVDTAKVKSDDMGKVLLDRLGELARNDGYMSEELQARIDDLIPLVTSDLKRDMRNNRSAVENYLGREIVGRYYGTAGELEYGLKFDDEFRTAADILKDKALYKDFLKP